MGAKATVLADIIVEIGIPLAYEMGKIIAFLIISSPLMLNYYHKSLFDVTKAGTWGSGSMIMHHYFLRKTTAYKLLSYHGLFLPSANE